MEQDPRTPNPTRENLIVFTLVLFLGGILVFFLDLISMGIFTYALGVGGLVFALGCFHYLLWGRAMSEEVAAERRELARAEEREAAAHAEGIQDLSRRRGIKRPRPDA
jgi:hypothetical protein